MTGGDSDLLESDNMSTCIYWHFGRVCHLQLQGLAVSHALLTLPVSVTSYRTRVELSSVLLLGLKISDVRTDYFQWHNNKCIQCKSSQCTCGAWTESVVRIWWGVRKLRKRWMCSIVCGSVHHSTIHKEKSSKMQQCIKILLFHIYMKLNMFWATHCPSSGA
jgi:hypothetical protein